MLCFKIFHFVGVNVDAQDVFVLLKTLHTLKMNISKYINSSSTAAEWSLIHSSWKVMGKSLIKGCGNLVWPGFFITVTEVKTHSASRSCVALFWHPPSVLVLMQSLLRRKQYCTFLNLCLSRKMVDYRECYCMWVSERNPFKTNIVKTSFTSLFDLFCFNRHLCVKIYWIKDVLLLFSLFFH